ncbi:MAG: protein kinase, partial [Gemmatimonadota bacterium]
LADRYRIERELGQGGMATVYLAEDLKHHRRVAIKVLRPELAAVIGAERFLREIKTIATLQHPHILGLIDSGEVEGTAYYVMPFVEGESLRDRLTRDKQLPIADAVRIATEVAEALDYAHRHGVIHRDIKPENILLHDGSALVADFGIALAVSSAGGTRLTETGLSLGTPNYMSPEQAMGQPEITPRSDVFALGCVLYEMLVGEPPFTGPTAQAIVARVMTEKPPSLIARRDRVPPALEDAVVTALEKLPADRFATAGEFAKALHPGAKAVSDRRSAVAGGPRPSASQTVWLGGALLAAVGVAAWGWLRPALPGPVTRSMVTLEKMAPFFPTGYSPLAISPSGSRIVYSDFPGQGLLLEQDRLHTRVIPGTENLWAPSLSPNGDSLVYADGFPGSLRLVPLEGGSTRVLMADSASGLGTAWSDNGWIYFFTGNGGTLRRIRPAGGPSERVAEVDSTRDELLLAFPAILPGGTAAVATVWRRKGPPDIVAIDFASHEIRPLTRGVRAFYAPTGHLVYVEGDGTLRALAFDAGTLRVSGRPVAIIEGILVETGSAQIALSANGTLVYRSARPGDQVVRVSRDGKAQPVDSAWRGAFGTPTVSPDGSRLAISMLNGGLVELWVKQLDHGPFTRLATGGTLNYRPSWSADGSRLLYSSSRDGLREELLVVRSDGSAAPRVALMLPTQSIDEGIWSPDDRWLIYRTGSGSGRDIYGMRPGIDTAPGLPLATTDHEEFGAALAPDGRWLAYGSDESGVYEIYVRPFPAVGTARYQVSLHGGSEPQWAHSGRELFYRDSAGDLVAVGIGSGSAFTIVSRQVLFDASAYQVDPNHSNYAVAPGDRTFYFIRPQSNLEPATVLVRNWFPELSAQMKAAH